MENKNYSEYIPYKELLSKGSLEKICTCLTLIEMQRGELLISDMKLDMHSYIVIKGILRGYVSTYYKEITFWFPKEGDIVTSTYGYFYKRKGYENFQALESVSLLKIDMEKMRNLYNENLEISKAFVNTTILISKSHAQRDSFLYWRFASIIEQNKSKDLISINEWTGLI